MTLASIKDNSPADGITVKTATVHTVTSDGKPVSGAAITWSVTGSAKLSTASGVTDSSGNASVNITNTAAEQITVTATSGSLSRPTPSAFVQYAASLNLQLTKNNSRADGSDQNAAQVTVKDAAGNTMPGIELTWQTGTGATVVSSDNFTDGNGHASIHFSSTTAGAVRLSATALGKTESTSASFMAEVVQNVAVTMTTNDSLANGTTANVAQTVVTNASGHPMSGVSVTWSLGTGSATATTPLTVTTNASGIATLNLTDTAVEGGTVTASAGGKSGNTTAMFSAIKAAFVTISTSGRGNAADPGITTAVVTDSQGNPLAGSRVSWSQTHSAYITCNAGDQVTDANGKSVQTCHAVSGNASGEIMKITVNPQDSVNPGTPLTAQLTRNFLL
ncbi:Ig-like domain-containing protein [Citrobacter youngae]|uniref:Bacterial group 1 Ig-like protein n=1 Tax=Citrobacter youngae ATCC 29220 TaxID=500640 RepID=D4BL43_9ENTR|nr:Ig-like domain-containing protein [Citrobacter youngae]EFE05362.1 bacterial group 1 Ig-like protein [Citrobacter youngae ATCC 29220]